MSPTSLVFGAHPPLQTSEPGTSPTCNFSPARPPLPFSGSCPTCDFSPRAFPPSKVLRFWRELHPRGCNSLQNRNTLDGGNARGEKSQVGHEPENGSGGLAGEKLQVGLVPGSEV